MPLLVRDLMTENPLTLSPGASLVDLRDLIEGEQVRHVPIVDENGGLVGVVSHRDLVGGALYGEGDGHE